MEDRKRAEALLREVQAQVTPYSTGRILSAFAEERRLERERCALIAQERGEYGIAARIRDAGPAEGMPPAESQGAPTASAPQEVVALHPYLPEPMHDSGECFYMAQGGRCKLPREAHRAAAAPEPLREAADALMEAASILDIAHNDHDAGARALAASRKARSLAAAPSAQPHGLAPDLAQWIRPPPPPTPQASETPAEREDAAAILTAARAEVLRMFKEEDLATGYLRDTFAGAMWRLLNPARRPHGR